MDYYKDILFQLLQSIVVDSTINRAVVDSEGKTCSKKQNPHLHLRIQADAYKSTFEYPSPVESAS
ncbi:hypothetical protein AMTR_s00052p00116530 [Amborella trichopoda]|uniref:Uncharacterized protein n=1 Tax=Amborella trichopoda TaxID=13333 RepID=U5D2B3_AMBTC|nr:hypothetical protein AMTR_s00052p00116530 [Amborella trichopoda]